MSRTILAAMLATGCSSETSTEAEPDSATEPEPEPESDPYECSDCDHDSGYNDQTPECLEDVDCEPGELCVGLVGSCRAVDSLPECPAETFSTTPIEDGEEPVLGLAFIDSNTHPGQDLLISRASGTRLVFGNGAEPIDLPLPEGLGSVIHTAVGGDFNDDGLTDIAYANGSPYVFTLMADEAEGWSKGPIAPATGPEQLYTIQLGPDDVPDLITLSPPGIAEMLESDGTGDLTNVTTILNTEDNAAVAPCHFDEDMHEDIIVQRDTGISVFAHDPEWGYPSPAPSLWTDQFSKSPPPGRTLLCGELAFAPPAEVVGYTAYDNDWTFVEVWREAGESEFSYALMHRADHGALIDYDGNGSLDVVLVGQERATVLPGTLLNGFSPPLECELEVPLNMEAERIAVGDFDGDDADELAIASDGAVWMFALQ